MLGREQQRVTQLLRALAVVLHQVIRHALRGFRPDTGQRAQRFDERRQGGRLFHAKSAASKWVWRYGLDPVTWRPAGRCDA